MIPAALDSAPLWLIQDRDPNAEARLQRELGVTPLLAAILVARGLVEPEEADRFLHPQLDHLHPPTLLPDYEAARNEILGARERGDLIFVHGDYDVDGVTSATIFDRFLSKIGCRVKTHVPHRMKEGYGIHASAVEAARAEGASLFLTCDCGISAFEQVEAAREAGMRVVVTDHHTVLDQLPSAQAVVNPHRRDSAYPWAELSGAGVAFKLCAGLTAEIDMPIDMYYKNFLDLAALGTIADVMPLLDENRIIARFGLQRLTETTKPGLVALKRVSDIGGAVNAHDVSFGLGPRINAAGRIDDAALAFELLLSTDPARAMVLAQKVDAINKARRAEQDRITEEAVRMVEEQGQDRRNVILIGHSSWHAGIVGIVAGKLVDRFRRPAFVATVTEDGRGKASARSIAKFDLAQALQAMAPSMVGGGHAMAAGCAFDYNQIEAIGLALHEYAGQFLSEEDFRITHEADLVVDPAEVTYAALEELSLMEPYGAANPGPLLVARGLTLESLKPTRKPEHVMVTLGDGARRISAMAFGLGARLEGVVPGAVADVLFNPCLDEYLGETRLKWHIRDFALR